MTMQFGEQPLIIRIEQVNGVWDIRPSRADSIGGVTHSDLMKQRLAAIPTIDQEYRNRRVPSAPAEPHFRRDPNHVPSVIKAGDRVQFRSEGNRPFTISVNRDDAVTADMTSPDNPFGWAGPVPVNNGVSVPFVVVAGTKPQRFYKCVARVDLGGGRYADVDPDVLSDL